MTTRNRRLFPCRILCHAALLIPMMLTGLCGTGCSRSESKPLDKAVAFVSVAEVEPAQDNEEIEASLGLFLYGNPVSHEWRDKEAEHEALLHRENDVHPISLESPTQAERKISNPFRSPPATQGLRAMNSESESLPDETAGASPRSNGTRTAEAALRQEVGREVLLTRQSIVALEDLIQHGPVKYRLFPPSIILGETGRGSWVPRELIAENAERNSNTFQGMPMAGTWCWEPVANLPDEYGMTHLHRECEGAFYRRERGYWCPAHGKTGLERAIRLHCGTVPDTGTHSYPFTIYFMPRNAVASYDRNEVLRKLREIGEGSLQTEHWFYFPEGNCFLGYYKSPPPTAKSLQMEKMAELRRQESHMNTNLIESRHALDKYTGGNSLKPGQNYLSDEYTPWYLDPHVRSYQKPNTSVE